MIPNAFAWPAVNGESPRIDRPAEIPASRRDLFDPSTVTARHWSVAETYDGEARREAQRKLLFHSIV